MDPSECSPLSVRQVVFPSLEAIAALAAASATTRGGDGDGAGAGRKRKSAAANTLTAPTNPLAAFATAPKHPLHNTAVVTANGWVDATTTSPCPSVSWSCYIPNSASAIDVRAANRASLSEDDGDDSGSESLQPSRKLLASTTAGDDATGNDPVSNSTTAVGAQSNIGASRRRPGRKPAQEEPSNKRTAQNRAAQRAFRERKERYVKELELKVRELEDEKNRLGTLVSESNFLAAAAYFNSNNKTGSAAVAAPVVPASVTASPSDVTRENSILRQRIAQLESENTMLRELSFSFDFSSVMPSLKSGPAPHVSTRLSSASDTAASGIVGGNAISSPSVTVTPHFGAGSPDSTQAATEFGPSPPLTTLTQKLFDPFKSSPVDSVRRWAELSAAPSSKGPEVEAVSQESAATPGAGPSPHLPSDLVAAFILDDAPSITAAVAKAGTASSSDDLFALLNMSPPPTGLLFAEEAQTLAAQGKAVVSHKAPVEYAAAMSCTVRPAVVLCMPEEDPKVIDDLCEIFTEKAQCDDVRDLQHKIVEACECEDRDQVLDLVEKCKEKQRMHK
ncbi:hypothetical protein HK405_009376, partial [Cladochytrium tenue]